MRMLEKEVNDFQASTVDSKMECCRTITIDRRHTRMVLPQEHIHSIHRPMKNCLMQRWRIEIILHQVKIVLSFRKTALIDGRLYRAAHAQGELPVSSGK